MNPTIVSMTITGNSGTLLSAISSTSHMCDRHLIVDTGVTDNTIDLVIDRIDDVHIVKFPWTGSFSDARNFAMDEAAKLGDWAIMVDSDETLRADGTDKAHLHHFLSSTRRSAFSLANEPKTVYRERIFRLPFPIRWNGRVHENIDAWRSPGGIEKYENLYIRDFPKAPSAFQAKLDRDEKALLLETKEHPNDPRWWFYLGFTYYNKREWHKSINAHRRVLSLPGWSEQAAWSAYQMAEGYEALADYDSAVHACLLGIERHAGFSELYWFAGVCAYRARNFEQAIRFAKAALAVSDETTSRTGFRDNRAFTFGPYDVLRHAYRAVGDATNAEAAEERYKEEGGPS